jgi:hypothetical protein
MTTLYRQVNGDAIILRIGFYEILPVISAPPARFIPAELNAGVEGML